MSRGPGFPACGVGGSATEVGSLARGGRAAGAVVPLGRGAPGLCAPESLFFSLCRGLAGVRGPCGVVPVPCRGDCAYRAPWGGAQTPGARREGPPPRQAGETPAGQLLGRGDREDALSPYTPEMKTGESGVEGRCGGLRKRSLTPRGTPKRRSPRRPGAIVGKPRRSKVWGGIHVVVLWWGGRK